MSEEKQESKRGGFRPGSGRKKRPDTRVVRVPESMVATVNLMVAAVKSGCQVEYRIIGTQSPNSVSKGESQE